MRSYDLLEGVWIQLLGRVTHEMKQLGSGSWVQPRVSCVQPLRWDLHSSIRTSIVPLKHFHQPAVVIIYIVAGERG